MYCSGSFVVCVCARSSLCELCSTFSHKILKLKVTLPWKVALLKAINMYILCYLCIMSLLQPNGLQSLLTVGKAQHLALTMPCFQQNTIFDSTKCELHFLRTYSATSALETLSYNPFPFASYVYKFWTLRNFKNKIWQIKVKGEL